MTTQEMMDAFFETHHYDEADDWRKTPATGEDPADDDDDENEE